MPNSLPPFQWFLRIMKAMKLSNPGGACFAIACAGIMAMLQRQLPVFYNRLNVLYEDTKDFSEEKLADYLEIEHKKIVGSGVYAFFHLVHLLQNAKNYSYLFEKLSKRNNFLSIYPLVQPVELGAIIKPAYFICFYKTLDDLVKYLSTWEKNLKDKNIDFPIALLLSNGNHAIAVGLNPRSIVDANGLSLQDEFWSIDKLAYHIHQGLFATPGMPNFMAMQVFIEEQKPKPQLEEIENKEDFKELVRICFEELHLDSLDKEGEQLGKQAFAWSVENLELKCPFGWNALMLVITDMPEKLSFYLQSMKAEISNDTLRARVFTKLLTDTTEKGHNAWRLAIGLAPELVPELLNTIDEWGTSESDSDSGLMKCSSYASSVDPWDLEFEQWENKSQESFSEPDFLKCTVDSFEREEEITAEKLIITPEEEASQLPKKIALEKKASLLTTLLTEVYDGWNAFMWAVVDAPQLMPEFLKKINQWIREEDAKVSLLTTVLMQMMTFERTLKSISQALETIGQWLSATEKVLLLAKFLTAINHQGYNPLMIAITYYPKLIPQLLDKIDQWVTNDSETKDKILMNMLTQTNGEGENGLLLIVRDAPDYALRTLQQINNEKERKKIINTFSKKGLTAIIVAIERLDGDTMEYLLPYMDHTLHPAQLTPLFWAAQKDSQVAVNLFLEKGAALHPLLLSLDALHNLMQSQTVEAQERTGRWIEQKQLKGAEKIVRIYPDEIAMLLRGREDRIAMQIQDYALKEENFSPKRIIAIKQALSSYQNPKISILPETPLSWEETLKLFIECRIQKIQSINMEAQADNAKVKNIKEVLQELSKEEQALKTLLEDDLRLLPFSRIQEAIEKQREKIQKLELMEASNKSMFFSEIQNTSDSNTFSPVSLKNKI